MKKGEKNLAFIVITLLLAGVFALAINIFDIIPEEKVSFSPTGIVSTSYIYAGSLIASKSSDNPGKTDYYIQDHLGSNRKIIDGVMEEQSNDFYAFGEEKLTTGTSDNDYKYTGKEKDDDTGLYYYGARYYNPEIGRFIQADSLRGNLADPLSLNRYAYVRNNPLKFVDPTGNANDHPPSTGGLYANDGQQRIPSNGANIVPETKEGRVFVATGLGCGIGFLVVCGVGPAILAWAIASPIEAAAVGADITMGEAAGVGILGAAGAAASQVDNLVDDVGRLASQGKKALSKRPKAGYFSKRLDGIVKQSNAGQGRTGDVYIHRGELPGLVDEIGKREGLKLAESTPTIHLGEIGPTTEHIKISGNGRRTHLFILDNPYDPRLVERYSKYSSSYPRQGIGLVSGNGGSTQLSTTTTVVK